MPTSAARVALYCLSRVSASDCLIQSACTAWLARRLFQRSDFEPPRVFSRPFWSSGSSATPLVPCLRAFLFPLGAPGDIPPCIRQRPFAIAGDRHRLPLLVRAPHPRPRGMGNLLFIAVIL